MCFHSFSNCSIIPNGLVLFYIYPDQSKTEFCLSYSLKPDWEHDQFIICSNADESNY